jgi:hypothetical protein
LIYCAGDKTDECYKVFQDYKREKDKYIFHKNKPVSTKINAIYAALKDIDFDYVVTGASDDLISDYAWRICEQEMELYKWHIIGFTDANFYDSEKNRAGYHKCRANGYNRLIGCYRFLHYQLIEALNFKPFSDGLNSGIDGSMEVKIKYMRGLQENKMELGNNGHIVDVKSNININSFDKLKKIFRLAETSVWPDEILRQIN